MTTELTYYIWEGLLTGFAAGRLIHICALSGGRGGTTVPRATTGIANNPYATGVKTSGTGTAHQHGGPLPVGDYTINAPAQHPHLGRSCRLDPDPRNRMHHRGGFFIHRQGPHGSDGCIVPLEHFDYLLDQVQKDGNGKLHVLETMSGARFA
jgi:hypothetical protein